MLVHEVAEVLPGVLTPGVLLQQLVEVAQHLVDRDTVLLGGTLQRLLHAGEALVEDLAAEEVLDLLVGLARLAALPVVRRQLAHRGRRRGGQLVELHLAEGAIVVVHHHVTGQLAPLGEDRLVEQLAHLLHRAVETVALEDVPPPLRDLAGEVVEAPLVLPAPAQELAHRPLGRVAGHHVLADVVQRLGEVDGGRQRVAAVVPAVTAHRSTLRIHTSSGHGAPVTRSTTSKPCAS